MRSSPPIDPALEHLYGVRNPAFSQNTEASFQIDMVSTVNSEGAEKIVETPLNGILKGVAKCALNSFAIKNLLS